MIIKYFTCGSESEKEGLTLAVNNYDENGNLIAGIDPKKLYKVKEISKEQYEAYLLRFREPNQQFGLPARGLLNEEGKAALAAYMKEQEDTKFQKDIAENEAQIALSVKKIKKLLVLEIIEQSDVDVEIEQQGMSRFKDEIKKRLEQN